MTNQSPLNVFRPCGHLGYDENFPFEVDSSAMGSQQKKWLESASSFLDRLCSSEPSALECRMYED